MIWIKENNWKKADIVLHNPPSIWRPFIFFAYLYLDSLVLHFNHSSQCLLFIISTSIHQWEFKLCLVLYWHFSNLNNVFTYNKGLKNITKNTMSLLFYIMKVWVAKMHISICIFIRMQILFKEAFWDRYYLIFLCWK